MCVCDALSTSLEFGQRWNPHGCKGCVDLHQKSPVVLQLSQFLLTTLAHIFLGSISASIAVNINNELLIYLIYHLGIAQLRRIGAHCCPSQR